MSIQHGGKRTTLTRFQQRTLEDWLSSVWEDVFSHGMSQDQVAKMARKASLPGLENTKITGGNIRGACRGIGKEWPFKRLVAAKETLTLATRVRQLEQRIKYLYQKLGEEYVDDAMEEARSEVERLPAMPTPRG